MKEGSGGMRAVLIPVKDLTRAKQRMASLFTQAERTRLAWAMMEHVFSEVIRAKGWDRVFVVTAYEPAARLARSLKMEVIKEDSQVSESRSVDYASRLCRGRGVRSLLRVPIDLPLLEAKDMEALLARCGPAPSALLVPSRDGDGTNALLRTPPDLFPSRFGPGSFRKHLREAACVGVKAEVVRLSSFTFDVDEPEDLVHVLRRGQGTPLFELLDRMDASARLRAASSTSVGSLAT